MLVNVGGPDRLVPEPKGNHRGVDSGLEQLYGCRVTENVRRDSFGCYGGEDSRSSGCVTSNQMCDGVSAERMSSRTREHRVVGTPAEFGHPGPQHGDCLGKQRCGALLPALAGAAQVGSGAEDDVLTTKPGQLRDPQPRLDGQQEQRAVPPAVACRAIWCRKQSLDLGPNQVGDQDTVCTLGGYGKHPLDESAKLWGAMCGWDRLRAR